MDEEKNHRRFRIGPLPIAVLAVWLFALLLGFVWNVALSWWHHKHNPVPGAFYSIDGVQMHIDCRGTGSPTIVLEAAASAPWSEWRLVQPELSHTTQVCSYDRAGHGWSTPRKGPRDAQRIVRELHSLLDHAEVQRPFVLVGHSAGGLYVREYAREFPDEPAAVALIESSSPRQIDELPGFRASYEEDKRDAKHELWEDRLRVWFGWERLLGRCSVSAKDFGSWKGQYDAMACRPDYVDTDESELDYFEESSKQAGKLTSFGNIPLLVITRDPNVRAGMTSRGIAQIPVWQAEQESSKSLSSLSWQVIARNSGHMVPHDRPELVIAQLELLIKYLRGQSEPPFGSTITR